MVREILSASALTFKKLSASTGIDLCNLTSFVRDVGTTISHLTLLASLIIASMHGYAIASGLEMMTGCELVITDQGARIGERHAKYGLLPAQIERPDLLNSRSPGSRTAALMQGERCQQVISFSFGPLTKSYIVINSSHTLKP